MLNICLQSKASTSGSALVVGCSAANKLLPLYVSRWYINQSKAVGIIYVEVAGNDDVSAIFTCDVSSPCRWNTAGTTWCCKSLRTSALCPGDKHVEIIIRHETCWRSQIAPLAWRWNTRAISPDVSSAWVKVWKESDRDAPGNGEVLGNLEQKILKEGKRPF